MKKSNITMENRNTKTKTKTILTISHYCKVTPHETLTKKEGKKETIKQINSAFTLNL
jgi:hypothetical protein